MNFQSTSGIPSVNATTNGTSVNTSSGGTSNERTMEPHPHLDEDHYDEEMDGKPKYFMTNVKLIILLPY